MTHLLIVPVLLPALLGAVMILALRGRPGAQRALSVAGGFALLGLALGLNALAMDDGIRVYRLGNWAAPFGIVLVLDRLAALMLLLTAVLALVVLAYVIGSGWDRRGRHFHALWQFQLMGICGAFLTGDAFNLFVFFEVMLIASYGLMVHGGGEMRLRAGVQYIAYNLAGSVLFLAALGVLYAVTGTLNMADMGARVAQLAPEDSALLRTGAVLLMLVFAIKAALVPLHFWLPSTYANAPGPVAALFAIMTKLGAYGIIRFLTLVFPLDSVVEGTIAALLLPAALVTLALGQIGVLGSRHLGRLAGFAAIGSVGTLMIAVAQQNPQATAVALYYLVHSTLAGAALFLVADLIGARRGELWLRPRPAMPGNGLVAALFMATAIAVTGMPPLSGFVGKLLILQATAEAPAAVWIWAVVLLGSLVAIYGMTRAGSILFWKGYESGPAPVAGRPGMDVAAIGLLLAGLVALTVLAGPAMRLAEDTALQLHDPTAYQDAVLLGQEGTK